MSEPITLQVAQRGIVTLPKALREIYKLEAGDTLTLIDLGGVFVLSPRRAEVDRLADQIASDFGRRGETLESMLSALRESRKQYGREA
jgi:bifunctional DNA-binding transcriptional regulator/antitoxin component of YhaV-PrlF toxin-antitoxin module